MQPSEPPPAGTDSRIYEIRNPSSDRKAANKTQVAVSGAVVVAVDRFDETKNGRSAGTIYVADMGSVQPYSGISLFNPAFIPGNLRVSPGDALDLRGEYQENNTIPLQFAPNAYLVQLTGPIGTFRFDTSLPPVKTISAQELENYNTGAQWLNMLVKVTDIELQGDALDDQQSGRLSVQIRRETNPDPRYPGEFRSKLCQEPFPKAPTVVNELFDLKTVGMTRARPPKSITGIVTFFCNLHIAPRSAADIEF